MHKYPSIALPFAMTTTNTCVIDNRQPTSKRNRFFYQKAPIEYWLISSHITKITDEAYASTRSNIVHSKRNRQAETQSRMSVLLIVVAVVVGIVHGQLSVDELFNFRSKYALTSPCSDFQYRFADLRLNSLVYNDLRLDCDSSTIILANREQTSASICSNETEYLRNFRIHFRPSSLIALSRQTVIQVNQLQLRGIEMSSLDDYIHQIYTEYSFFRSRWALLINLEQAGGNKWHHLALASNDEMTFLVFLFARESNPVVIENSIDLVFPQENFFTFNRSQQLAWRIDQGFVRIPNLLEAAPYQLSKNRFTLFGDEIFLIYGVHSASMARRLLVLIDDTRVICVYNSLLRCTFPILPRSIGDTHQPTLKVKYYGEVMFNASLTLVPRTRLHLVPVNFTLLNISAFEVTIDENLCR